MVVTVLASQLRPGVAILCEGQSHKIPGRDYHPGQGRMGGVARARLNNLSKAGDVVRLDVAALRHVGHARAAAR